MEPLRDLNSLDWVILAVVFISVLGSLLKGFAREAFSLASVVVGIVLASWLYPMTSSFFLQFVSSQDLAAILGFVTIFCGMSDCRGPGLLLRPQIRETGSPAVVRSPAGSRFRTDSRMDDRCRSGSAPDGLPGAVGQRPGSQVGPVPPGQRPGPDPAHPSDPEGSIHGRLRRSGETLAGTIRAAE